MGTTGEFERYFVQTAAEGGYQFDIVAEGTHDCSGEAFVRYATRAVYVSGERKVWESVLERITSKRRK